MSSRRILEVKVIHGESRDPEVFQLDIADDARKLNILVFRQPTTLTEKEINQLVNIARATTGNACGALLLGEHDKFEVYEVEIQNRYDREQVI